MWCSTTTFAIWYDSVWIITRRYLLCFSCFHRLPCMHNSSASRYHYDPQASGTFRSPLYAWEHSQDWSPCTNPLGGFLLGQQSHQETPHCCKKHWCARASCRNSFVDRGEFCRASSSRRKNPHNFWLSYNTLFLIHFCANHIRGRVLLWWK